jgi:hypothetical protein
VGQPTDQEEAGRVEWIPMASILGMISRNEIIGSGSLVGLLHVIASRHADQGPSSVPVRPGAESVDVES